MKPDVRCDDSFRFAVVREGDRKSLRVELTNVVVAMSDNKLVTVRPLGGEVSPSARPWEEGQMKAAPTWDTKHSIQVGLDFGVWPFCDVNRGCGNWLLRSGVYYSASDLWGGECGADAAGAHKRSSDEQNRGSGSLGFHET
jgi:hypothetical protein